MSDKNSATRAIGWIALPPDCEFPGFPPDEPGGPIDPGPIDPGPIDPGPIDPGPIDPGPIDPGPFDFDPFDLDPTPFDPGPIHPSPIDPIDFDPANDSIFPKGYSPVLPDFPPGGLPIPVEDELFTPTVPDNCCLTEPPPVFWVCSQYSGPYPGGYDYGGWVNYGGGLVSAWNPPPPLQAKSFCSCSPRFIYANDSVVLVPLALSP